MPVNTCDTHVFILLMSLVRELVETIDVGEIDPEIEKVFVTLQKIKLELLEITLAATKLQSRTKILSNLLCDAVIQLKDVNEIATRKPTVEAHVVKSP